MAAKFQKNPVISSYPEGPQGERKGLAKVEQDRVDGLGKAGGRDAMSLLKGRKLWRANPATDSMGEHACGADMCRKNTTQLSQSSPDTQLSQDGPARRN